jgi:hypothetical protein
MSPPRHWIEAKRKELAKREAEENRGKLVRATLATIELACIGYRLRGEDCYQTLRRVAKAVETAERGLGQQGVCPEESAGV